MSKILQVFMVLIILVFYIDAAGLTQYSVFFVSMTCLLYFFYKYNKTFFSFMYAVYIFILMILPTLFLSLDIGTEYSSYTSYSLYALGYVTLYVLITIATYQIMGLKTVQRLPQVFSSYYPTRCNGIECKLRTLMLLFLISILAKVYLDSIGQFRMLDDEQASSIVSYVKVIGQLDLFVLLAMGYYWKLGFKRKIFRYYIFIAILMAFIGVYSGSRYSVVAIFIIIFFNHFYFFRSKIFWLAPLVIPIMMIFPIIGIYRSSGYSMSISDSLAFALASYDLVGNAIGILIDRMNYIGVVSTVIDQYKDNSVFLSDYFDNFTALIPRLAWPDKPVIGVDLNDLGIQLEILPVSDTKTSIGLTTIGESYYQLRNFGLIVALFQGLIFGLLDKIKISGSLLAHVYYYYAVTLMLFLDSYTYFLPQLVQASIAIFLIGYLFNKPLNEENFETR